MKNGQRLIMGGLVLGLMAGSGCERDHDDAVPAGESTNHEVFLDGFGPGLDFQAFTNSLLTALAIDYLDTYSGSQSLRITVPAEGNPDGWFAGGAFVLQGGARDLSGYDALSFYAKASMAASIGAVGVGNNNQGTSLYATWLENVPVGTTWQHYLIPLPLPGAMTAETGLFHFAAGAVDGAGFTLWLDEVEFVQTDEITDMRPAFADTSYSSIPGSVIVPENRVATFNVAGTDQSQYLMPAYYTLSSSDEDVALPADDGTVTILANGDAEITGRVGSVAATGTISIVGSSFDWPTEPAPAPELPAQDVISLYSDVYTDLAVDSWSADWDIAEVQDIQLQGDAVKLYTGVAYAGIDFSSSLLDASAMNFLHMDVYTPTPEDFRIKLVDFGADGVYNEGGGDDSEHELALGTLTWPTMLEGEWSRLDIPLEQFSGLQSTGHLAQMILSGSPTFFIDNIYFYHGDPITAPLTPAPAPTYDAGNVISLYSDVYEDATVDTWSADWATATLEETAIEGDNLLHYSGLGVAGIEFLTQPLDLGAMNGFHLDLWTLEDTGEAEFRIKLVDLGADGVIGTGDDSEHEVSISQASYPQLRPYSWVSVDLSLGAFTGLSGTGHMGQLILSGDLGSVYVDNIYFHDQAIPQVAAPTPTVPADSVFSIYSDAYTNLAGTDFNPNWQQSTQVEQIEIDGNLTLYYRNFNYQGTHFGGTTPVPQDVSGYGYIHVDFWTPNATALNFFLVSDSSGERAYELPITLEEWVSVDIPLSHYSNLGLSLQDIKQFKITGGNGMSTEVFFDNWYFHGVFTGGNTGPEPAPAPTFPEADVISLYSDSYTPDVTVDTWLTNWSQGFMGEVDLEGNAARMYTVVNYVGIEFLGSPVDASSMTHFHLSFYTPDETALPVSFRIKLVDFGSGTVNSEHEVIVDASSATPLATGTWISIDLPLSQFTGLESLTHLNQLVLSSGTDTEDYIETFYLDNVLFHR